VELRRDQLDKKSKKNRRRLKVNERTMSGNSLGIVETLGMWPSIVAVDAMLKAANVELLRYEKVGLGWVICAIAGNVAAVRTALEAGHSAAEEISKSGVAASVISGPLGGSPPFNMVNTCMIVNPNPQVWYWTVGGEPLEEMRTTGGAIGYIDVLTFVIAVLSVDAMVKGATVQLLGYTGVPPRYVVWIKGDVGAVKQAVDSGVSIAMRNNMYVASQIIARPEADTLATIPVRQVVSPVDVRAITESRLLKLAPPPNV
jgi:microcompartment protein CcmL/EutN